MKNLKPIRILTAVCLLLAAVLMTGCTKKKAEIHSLADLKNEAYTIGMPADISMQDRVMELCPQAELLYMDGVAFIEPLRSGRIDAFIGGEMELLPISKEYSADGFTVLDEPLATYEIALGLSPATPVENYEEKVNACIRRYKEDGTMDEMKARWAGINPVKAEITAPSDPVYTIKAATCGVIRPNTYYENGVLTGLDVELAERIAADLGCGIEWEVADFGAMLAGLATGKYDMVASNLFKTAERAEAIIYSDSYFESRICLITVHTEKETGFNSSENLKQTKTFFSDLTDGFTKTFIREERWKMILSGLGVTLLITLGSFVLANLLGALFCGFNLSGNRALHVAADVYSRIMQGTPIVVVLMILYYVVFGKTQLRGEIVSIVGFGLVSGAGLAQTFEESVRGVDRGQTEAALALGFSPAEAFRGIIFPQAARAALPGYFSELIALLKGTSIVGYIAVVDLTKASDIIRASTYEAFFPLISIAAIYFIIINILLSVMKAIRKGLAPKRATGKEAEK